MKPGDKIRIHDDAPCNPALQGKVAIVDEVKGFGCVAWVATEEGPDVPVRLETGSYDELAEEEVKEAEWRRDVLYPALERWYAACHSVEPKDRLDAGWDLKDAWEAKP